MIELSVRDPQWVKGYEDDPTDQCAHGRVFFRINDSIFVRPEDGLWTVSASALYLLRSLSEDHTIQNPVAEANFLFPCCGFNIWPIGRRFKILCMGCTNGMDLEIIHEQDRILVRSQSSLEVTTKSEWTKAVLGFADSVRSFYHGSGAKVPLEDDLDKLGWAGFWQEWHERYHRAASSLTI